MPSLERLITLDHLQIRVLARTGPWPDSKSSGGCYCYEPSGIEVETSSFAEFAELEEGNLIAARAKMKRMLVSSQIN